MSFPEIPLLVYPSIAKRYGVEEALLYFICNQLLSTEYQYYHAENHADLKSKKQIKIAQSKWSLLTNMWAPAKLQSLCESVERQALLSISMDGDQVFIQEVSVQNADQDSNTSLNQSVVNSATINKPQLTNLDTHYQSKPSIDNVSDFEVNKRSATLSPEPIQVLPVYDVPPAPAPMPLPKRRVNDCNGFPIVNTGEILKNIGPAPSFGGSTGWKKRANNELQTIFDQQEVLNKQLQSMTMDWKPSSMFYATLSRSNIPAEFVNGCLDEFILFYCDKNKKERSWDQKFLAWIKRAWVKQESNNNRANSSQQQTGSGHENSQRDTREKRKRITAAIMDIHDTNW